MDRDQVATVKNVFMNTVNSCTTKIDYTEFVYDIDYFTNAIKFRSGAIVYQVTYLKVIFGPPVKWHYHRESINSIWKTFNLHDELKI